MRGTYGYAKQGAGRGYTGVKGLNALLAIVSTPSSAPVIAAARLRKGTANSALASPFHAKGTTGTIRAQLITVPARLARSARGLVVRLPTNWPWATAWTRLVTGAGPPTTT
jgi:hypothetical protein